MLDDGAIRFVKPTGHSFDSVIPGFTQPILDWTEIPIAHERAQIHINERTAATRWGGESMDYGLAVQVLVQQESRRGIGRGVCRMGLPIARPGERSVAAETY